MEHDSLRFGQHEVASAPGQLYTLLVGHKKLPKLEYQAMKPTLECSWRSVDFKDLDQNLQIFFEMTQHPLQKKSDRRDKKP